MVRSNRSFLPTTIKEKKLPEHETSEILTITIEYTGSSEDKNEARELANEAAIALLDNLWEIINITGWNIITGTSTGPKNPYNWEEEGSLPNKVEKINKSDSAAIRGWARNNGWKDLSDRGRIPADVMKAYSTKS